VVPINDFLIKKSPINGFADLQPLGWLGCHGSDSHNKNLLMCILSPQSLRFIQESLVPSHPIFHYWLSKKLDLFLDCQNKLAEGIILFGICSLFSWQKVSCQYITWSSVLGGSLSLYIYIYLSLSLSLSIYIYIYIYIYTYKYRQTCF
jgi:hypothetical protein